MSTRRKFSAFAELALPVPLPKTFSYGVPEALARAAPGVRARVRFGARVLIGCITSMRTDPPDLPAGTQLQPLLGLLDDEPVLTSDQLELVHWITDYYIASPGLVCRGLLPPETPRFERILYERVQAGEAKGMAGRILDVLERPMTARTIAKALDKKSVAGTLASLLRKDLIRTRRDGGLRGARKIRVARITDKGTSALAEEKLHPTTSRILTLLSVATDPVPIGTIRNELDIDRGPFPRLAHKGYIELLEQTVPRRHGIGSNATAPTSASISPLGSVTSWTRFRARSRTRSSNRSCCTA